MLTIRNFVFNAFQENTLVVFDETCQAVIIDPGCYELYEQKELDDFVLANKLNVVYLLNTHCHIDHVLGNYHVQQKYKVPLLIHPREEPVLKAVKSYASNYGYPNYQEPTSFEFLGEAVKFGNTVFDVLSIPGHAPGHVGFYCSADRAVFSGDVLFNRSIGRTDLPFGNLDVLMASIHQVLFPLPDDVVVYPGHGPATTIGEEKTSNPYCAISLLRE